jgi:hypothetical protein
MQSTQKKNRNQEKIEKKYRMNKIVSEVISNQRRVGGAFRGGACGGGGAGVGLTPPPDWAVASQLPVTFTVIGNSLFASFDS